MWLELLEYLWSGKNRLSRLRVTGLWPEALIAMGILIAGMALFIWGLSRDIDDHEERILQLEQEGDGDRSAPKMPITWGR